MSGSSVAGTLLYASSIRGRGAKRVFQAILTLFALCSVFVSLSHGGLQVTARLVNLRRTTAALVAALGPSETTSIVYRADAKRREYGKTANKYNLFVTNR